MVLLVAVAVLTEPTLVSMPSTRQILTAETALPINELGVLIEALNHKSLLPFVAFVASESIVIFGRSAIVLILKLSVSIFWVTEDEGAVYEVFQLRSCRTTKRCPYCLLWSSRNL